MLYQEFIIYIYIYIHILRRVSYSHNPCRRTYCEVTITIQVAAQTGHSVVLVDQTDAILQKAKERIATSLKRVASKQYPDDAKVSSFILQCTFCDLTLSAPINSSSSGTNLIKGDLNTLLDNLIKLIRFMGNILSPIYTHVCVLGKMILLL